MVLFQTRPTKLYRAKGRYEGSPRKTYLTKSYARTREGAERDIEVYGKRYTDLEVTEFDEIEGINRGKIKRLQPKHD